MMQLTGTRRVNEDSLSSLETAGTRQLLILLMNFTNVIFRLDYFKPSLKARGNTLHSTSIPPRQSLSLDTAWCTALPTEGFYGFSPPEAPESILTAPPKPTRHTDHRAARATTP